MTKTIIASTAPDNAKRIRTMAGLLSALSILPHLFCCLLPTVAALIALGTTAGLGAALSHNKLYLLVDAYHPYLLVLAFVSVGISAIVNVVAWRMDCHANSTLTHHHGHDHAACEPKKRNSFKIFWVSCVLLCVDVAWFLTETKVLDLHNHGRFFY